MRIKITFAIMIQSARSQQAPQIILDQNIMLIIVGSNLADGGNAVGAFIRAQDGLSIRSCARHITLYLLTLEGLWVEPRVAGVLLLTLRMCTGFTVT